MNEATLTIVGNVVNDPELNTTRSGIPVASFRVASTSRHYDREAGAMVKGETLFLQVQCWRGLATNVARTLRKGAPVVVQGRLQIKTKEILSDDGPRRRTFTTVEAQAVGLDLARLPIAAQRDEAA